MTDSGYFNSQKNRFQAINNNLMVKIDDCFMATRGFSRQNSLAMSHS